MSDKGFEVALAGKFSECYELLLRKHRDYGPSNIAFVWRV